MMVSSPTYDPDELVGRERGNNYMKMLGNKRQPLYNRAVKAKYPPGSTFKLVQGLIGLQEGGTQALGPARLPRRLSGRPPAHEVPRPRFAAGPALRRGDLVQRLFLLCLPRYPGQPQIRERQGRVRCLERVCRELSVSAASSAPTSSTSATATCPTGATTASTAGRGIR